MTHDPPPRWSVRLLERVLPAGTAHALVGDLLEEHALRARFGRASDAMRWYWAQVIGSLAPLLCSAVARGRWLLPMVVGFTAYSVVDAARVAAEASVAALPEPRAAHAISVLIVSIATIVPASYAAARIGRGAAAVLALLVALGAAKILIAPSGMPSWYGASLLIAGPLAAAAGGALSVRRRDGAASERTTTEQPKYSP
jgi:hypothetical protein